MMGTGKEINPRTAFTHQKNHAKHRGIAWEFSFEQWWQVWQRSGHWSGRGRGGTEYAMCRNGDIGPYSAGNVFIATIRENSSIQPRKKSGLPMGVKRKAKIGAFEANRRIKGKITYLGTFPTAAQAHAAYLRAWGELP